MSKNLASDRKKTSAVSLIMSYFYSDRNLLFIHVFTAILQNLTTMSISSESTKYPILTLFIASIGKLRKYIFHDDEDTAESENVGGYLTLV